MDAQKTQKERNILGQFSTPYPLALDIMNYLKGKVDKDSLAFLEPAIGTGVFYSAFLAVFGDKTPHKALGFEIDKHYFSPASMFWEDSDLEIRNADFLEQSPEKEFSLLVTNPPYTRHHHIDSEKKRFLQKKVLQYTGIKISGLAGLYCYFLLLSSQWLTDNALSCWLIPSEFMDVNFGQALKEYLLNNVDLMQIHRFSPEDLQFSDALITSSIVVFRNNAPTNHSIIFSFGGNISNPCNTKELNRSDLCKEKKWSPLFSSRTCNHSDLTIGDFFQVKRGVATGNNDFFIVDEKTIEEYQIPQAFLQPILPSPRYILEDKINSVDGVPAIEQKLFLFSCELSESDIRKMYPKLWKYIQQGNEKGIPNSYICRRRTPWYSCEKRKPAPFVMPYMGRSEKSRRMFRFILNESKAMATNVYLLLYPKPQYESKMKEKDVLLNVWRELNSISKESLVDAGRVYGGGLYKLEPKELMNAPATGIADILGKTDLFVQQTFPF